MTQLQVCICQPSAYIRVDSLCEGENQLEFSAPPPSFGLCFNVMMLRDERKQSHEFSFYLNLVHKKYTK